MRYLPYVIPVYCLAPRGSRLALPYWKGVSLQRVWKGSLLHGSSFTFHLVWAPVFLLCVCCVLQGRWSAASGIALPSPGSHAGIIDTCTVPSASKWGRGSDLRFSSVCGKGFPNQAIPLVPRNELFLAWWGSVSDPRKTAVRSAMIR